MTSETLPEQSLSALFRSALDTDKDGVVTLGEVAERVAERGFGLFLILMALPMLIPMPPGTSGPIGALYILLGAQMLAGRKMPWLPRRAREYRLSQKVTTLLQTKGVATLQFAERFSRPRLSRMDNPVSLRFFALLIMFIGLVLSLPLPFMNSIPAIPVLFLGIGLMNRDGVFLAIGGLLGLALAGFLAFGWKLFLPALTALYRRTTGWMGL